MFRQENKQEHRSLSQHPRKNWYSVKALELWDHFFLKFLFSAKIIGCDLGFPAPTPNSIKKMEKVSIRFSTCCVNFLARRPFARPPRQPTLRQTCSRATLLLSRRKLHFRKTSIESRPEKASIDIVMRFSSTPISYHQSITKNNKITKIEYSLVDVFCSKLKSFHTKPQLYCGYSQATAA